MATAARIREVECTNGVPSFNLPIVSRASIRNWCHVEELLEVFPAPESGLARRFIVLRSCEEQAINHRSFPQIAKRVAAQDAPSTAPSRTSPECSGSVVLSSRGGYSGVGPSSEKESSFQKGSVLCIEMRRESSWFVCSSCCSRAAL